MKFGFTPRRKIRVLYHEVLAEGNSGSLIQHSYRTHKYAAFTKCKASGFKNLAVLYLLLGLEGLRLLYGESAHCGASATTGVLFRIVVQYTASFFGLSKKAQLLEFRNLPPGRLQNSFSPP
jgi:hypothetical protein